MSKIIVGQENGADVTINYQDVGTGAPVVLIHGWPLSSRSWEKQVPALVDAGYRVITYDRRGFGESSQPWEGYDYDTLASDLNAIITDLDLEAVTLVGFSMGGGEVVRYISTYGTSRLVAAVLAAAVPPFLAKTDGNPEGAIDDALAAEFTTGIKTDRLAFLTGFIEDFYSTGKGALGGAKVLGSEAQRAYSVAIAAAASPKATLDCVTAFGTTDFRKEVSAITLPVLVIHGDSDQVVPFEASGARTADAVDGAELKVIHDAPHGFNDTHAEEFNAALIDFLARSATGPNALGRDDALGATSTVTATSADNTNALEQDRLMASPRA